MAAKKEINVGLVGYGFMGRTHSNAFGKVNQFFDLGYRAGAQGGVRTGQGEGRRLSPGPGTTNPSRPTGASSSSGATSTLSTSPLPTTRTPRSRVAAAAAGKMVMCEKPLGRNAAESAKMTEAVERANVPNMVWYNYRRVPAVTLAKHLIDEGRLGKIYHYRAKFLQDWTISPGPAAGRNGALASRRRRCGQRRDRRLAGALHRHGDVAQRRHRQGHRDDRDLRQGADAQPDRQGRAGPHRRRQSLPCAFRQRLAREFRGHPLRARPQGALHVRDQRRTRVDLLGPARSASAAVFRSPRRGDRARLAVDPHHRQRPSLHERTGGCPACRSATSILSSTRSPTSWTGSPPGRRRRRRSGTRSPPTG